GQQCLLHGVLAEIELAVAAHQRAEDVRRQLPELALDDGVRSHISIPPSFMMGRTSMAVNFASGIMAASSWARAGVSHSTMYQPARNSFASTNGPSVTAGTPPRTRTVALFGGSAKAAKLTSSPESFSDPWNSS